jgi:membrane-associated protease RseP (regulator of RpoE activity)
VNSEFPEKDPAVRESAPAGEASPAVLTDLPRYAPVQPAPLKPERRRIPALNAVLFLLTLLTTTMAGAYMEGAAFSIFDPIGSIVGLATGLSFSLPLMAILLAHEMGHYVTARRNRVDVTLPYFIPAPFPSLFIIGTFGAFIRIKSMPRSRRTMFDIGAAGPWAGFIVALPVLIVGLGLSHVATSPQSGDVLEFGNSLIFIAIARWIVHVDPNVLVMGPVAFAGWLGLFVTTLNLLPASQLDGGHVVYALLGRRHRMISRLVVLACILMVLVPFILGMEFWYGWLFWAVLLFFFGLGHPATADVDTPLDPMRRFAAWATIALFIGTFTPVPVSFAPAQPEQQQQQLYNVSTPAPRLAPGRQRIAL